MRNMLNEGFKYVNIVFENCEEMKVPYDSIYEFEINPSTSEIKLGIRGIDKIIYNSFGFSMSPIDRINRYDDITSLEVVGELTEIIPINWYDIDSQENRYQKSNVISFNDIEITISKEVVNERKLKMHKQAVDEMLSYFDNIKCEDCYLFRKCKCKLGEKAKCKILKEILED